jgi:hypothetical protein
MVLERRRKHAICFADVNEAAGGDSGPLDLNPARELADHGSWGELVAAGAGSGLSARKDNVSRLRVHRRGRRRRATNLLQ